MNTEWHHTGKSFRKTDYYSWADSEKNNGNIDYSIDDNGVRNYGSNSLAGIYKANKKEISKLAKEYEDKKFEYKEKRKKLLVPTFDYFFKRNVFVHLTEKEEDEKRKQHDLISTEGKEQGLSGFDRYVEHEKVDRYYNEILQERKKEAIQDERERSTNRQKYEEEFGESIAKNAEIEAENALIDEHNASLNNSKEATLIRIAQIMGIDQEQAKQKVESISDKAQMEGRIKEWEKQRDEQVAKIEEKIDKLIAKNKANGKIVERTRIKEKPELFETSKEEMNGRYGWFEASSTYRLPVYYSGLEFLDKNVYKKYRELSDEKRSTLYKRPEFNIETDENNEHGTVYGAAVGNTIYLNGEHLTPETPIHEYTHLWDETCKRSNPELWQRGVELMKQTPLWEEVKRDHNYAGLDEDGIASEVHSRLTGKNGAKKLEEIVSKSKSKGAVSAAKAVSLKEQLKQWLSDFWYWVKDTFTPWTKEEADRVSLEDFINMPLKDLALGTDLRGNGMTAEENGYDGVIFRNIRDGVDFNSMNEPTNDYVTFASNQIKSATDNIGTFDRTNPDIRYNKSENVSNTDEDNDTLYRSDDTIKNRIEALFNQAILGEFKGKSISIGRLTDEGKAYLEQISGVSFKDKVDLVLNPSDLVHIYKDHFGNNEKDKGQNVPLDIEYIRSLSDVISNPDKVIFFKEGEGSNRNMFYFFKEAENGTYNLMEIYSDKKGNLTAKTFYKTKKGSNQRVIDIAKSLLRTSETFLAHPLSNAKIPKMFESASVENDFSVREGVGAYADDEVSRMKLRSYQDSYAKAMERFGLSRGIVASGARHQSQQQYRRNQVLEIETEISKLQSKKTEIERSARDGKNRLLSWIGAGELPKLEKELEEKDRQIVALNKKIDELQKQCDSLKSAMVRERNQFQKEIEAATKRADEWEKQ